ncbi:hypothetical protein [Legionella fallonii]|uniref:Coiled coil domain-containing protein n=1 Tax=Legionella fallonii LLAP-10 TaxID=1212491 RepID=A0A098G4F7_9GAMM|nr:hypothetical protein [Legionella fallonii]CEG57378.1 conserved protein of unknown function [Legionella fallonii LLAP-10]
MASPFIKPILGRIPLIGPLLKSNSRLKMFTPEEKLKLNAEYRNALGLGDKATFSDAAFDAFNKGSFRDLNQFEKTKCPDGKTILEKLGASNLGPDSDHKENVAYVRSSMKAILEPTPEFTQAQQDYKDSIAVFQDLKKKVPKEIRAEALIGLMTEIKDEAITAIEAQHKKEKDQLEELFKDDENLKEALTQTLGLSGDADLKVVKDNLMKDLEESHKTQLDEFKKSTTESVTALHKAAAAQNNHLIFIANLHKNNKEMRDEINRIAAQNRANLPPDPTTVTIGINPKHMTLSGVTVDQLPMIKSLTGKEIKQSKPGTFEIEFSWSISPSEFLYNQDPRQNHLTDMTLMAEAVRASGYDTVTFDVNIDPDSVAMERARQAYEGAINAGFPRQANKKPDKDDEPDHIVIMVNGKEMRADELFKGHESRLQEIHKKSEKIESELKDINEFKPRTLDTTTARAEMERLRDEYRERRLAEEAEEDEELDTGASLTSHT